MSHCYDRRQYYSYRVSGPYCFCATVITVLSSLVGSSVAGVEGILLVLDPRKQKEGPMPAINVCMAVIQIARNLSVYNYYGV